MQIITELTLDVSQIRTKSISQFISKVFFQNCFWPFNRRIEQHKVTRLDGSKVTTAAYNRGGHRGINVLTYLK